jgi:hypothetical protein
MTNPLSSSVSWVKANKLSAFLLAALAFLLLRSLGDSPVMYATRSSSMERGGVMMDYAAAPAPMRAKSMGSAVDSLIGRPQNAGISTSQERMITKDTSLSIKTTDVADSIRKTEALATQLGGFFVNSSVSAIDEGADGSISIRIPSVRRDEALTALREFGVRVVSESVHGSDITDQYQDVTEQLRILTSTKSRFESLLNRAESIADMLEAQRELMNLQSQIDSLKGQQDYLAKSTEYSLISVFYSTDELALPYTSPSTAWRPGVVFKEAVRSLLDDVRALGNGLIWVGVYAPLWVPAILGYLWWQKRQNKV